MMPRYLNTWFQEYQNIFIISYFYQQMMPRTSTAADTQPSATLFRDPTLRKKKSQTQFLETLSCFFQAVESTCIQGFVCSELSILAPCPLLGQPAHLDSKVLVQRFIGNRNMHRFACLRKCIYAYICCVKSHCQSRWGYIIIKIQSSLMNKWYNYMRPQILLLPC